MDTARISLTAHYTGTVWQRAGLAHPAMRGATVSAAFYALEPVMWLGGPLCGGLDLEDVLLQRHHIIDAILSRAVEAGEVGQVVEIAGGLSSRGLRFAERYPTLTYIEGDLPGMVARKQQQLDRAGWSRSNHRLQIINAFHDDGPQSIAAVAGRLRSDVGTAIITEGLINYFDRAAVEGIWARLGRLLDHFPRGLYLSDVRLDEAAARSWVVRMFMGGLSVVARGRVHSHFSGADEAREALAAAGLGEGRVHAPADWAELPIPQGRRGDLLHIIEARR